MTMKCWTLDIYCLAANKAYSWGQIAAAAAPTCHNDKSFLLLLYKAAKTLEVECLSSLPTQKPLQFVRFFLPPEPVTEKSMPVYPDFVAEVTLT